MSQRLNRGIADRGKGAAPTGVIQGRAAGEDRAAPCRGPGLLTAMSACSPHPALVWLKATRALGKLVQLWAQSLAGSCYQQQLPAAFWRQPVSPSAVTGFSEAAQHRYLVLSTRTEFLSHISALPTCSHSPVSSTSQSLPRI